MSLQSIFLIFSRVVLVLFDIYDIYILFDTMYTLCIF